MHDASLGTIDSAARGGAPTARGVELRDVIAEFMSAAEEGRARRSDGQPYSREELRGLRAALSHVDYAFGATNVRALRAWRVQGLLDQLSESGLSERRMSSIVDGVRALFAYAGGLGLVSAGPVVGVADRPPDREFDFLAEEPRTAQAAGPRTSPVQEPGGSGDAERPSPTYAVLSLATHAVTWTVRFIVIAFALVGAVLLIEFL